jgi:subtilisin family serine protease
LKSNNNLFRTGLVLLLSVLVAACGGGGGGGAAAVPATLTSITVTPANPALKLNRTLQLTATGHYSRGAPRDLTATVTWASSSTGVATITPSGGLVTPVGAAGQTTTITATSGTVVGNSVITLAPLTFTVAAVTDPLAGQQWHIKNTGQNPCAYADGACSSGFDVNAEPVYNNTASAGACGVGVGCTGYGVKVAVADTGLEIAHEDLAANVILNGSWNFGTNTTNPTNTWDTDGDHGTSVSGLIASAWYNGKGGMGVAPEAALKGFNILNSKPGYTLTDADYNAAIGGSTASPNSSDVAIFNQSFGASSSMQISETAPVVAQYLYGVTSLRGGLGALYVKAAGNGFEDINGSAATCGPAAAFGISCENANFDIDNVLPYNIVVGALNAAGEKSSYSTTGSAIWVSAPGGEYGFNSPPYPGSSPEAVEPAMITTDQSGTSAGYAQNPNPYSPYVSNFDLCAAPDNTSCNYTSTMNGTSSATPVTVGVIALMLEANPALTWRDVKHILASTAVQVDSGRAAITAALTGGSYTAEPAWMTNGAGYKYHNWYGFGLVDAAAAVTMAKGTCSSGCSLGTQLDTGWLGSGTISIAIPDFNVAGASSTIGSVPARTIESVQIRVSLTHSFTGDLGIELTSPAGTRSVLKNIRDGFNAVNLSGMLLLTNAFYGESSGGSWTIKVVDGQSTTNTTGGTLTNWQIRILGH